MNGNLKNLQSLTGKIKSFRIDTTLTKKGMCAESKAVGDALAAKVNISDIIDDLLSVASDKPLSANQGRLLKKLIDEIDPHYAENVLYNDTNVKDALDKVSNAENISYDSDKSVQGAIDELKGTIGYTSKNLIPYPHYHTTRSENGIDWTDLRDGRVQANGTATNDTVFQLRHRLNGYYVLKNGSYIINGVPKDIKDKGCTINVSKNDEANSTTSSIILATDYGDGAKFTSDTTENVGIYIVIPTGVTLDNVIFEPMLRYASIQDDTYEPYVEDVQTRVNEFIQFNFYQTLSSQTNKPWLEIQAQYDKLIGGRMYMGKVFCGMVFQYIGYAINAKTHAAFFLHAYDGSVYHVTYINGTWKYTKFATSYTTVS